MDISVFDFYSKLEQPAKDFLKMRLHPVEAPADTLLFNQGDICDSVLFLTSGEIKLTKQTDEGEELLYTLQPGQQCIVNTASTLSQTPAIATATSTTEITGYILDMYSLQDLTKRSEPYMNYIFSIYTLDCKS
ncbi:Crp/Fnr family transcriptional regulator [Sulfurimonas microaerophilic]|uniref:Crp/Fnr family transcriptional regulator n=1 Tax=Sulfurimonas microaerophilic TaxID=3058392 RepID=UPI002714D725|nr:cyclic nucleotide-binding domain-containing protein [Sulfurimonas sp. hsl 1-7]